MDIEYHGHMSTIPAEDLDSFVANLFLREEPDEDEDEDEEEDEDSNRKQRDEDDEEENGYSLTNASLAAAVKDEAQRIRQCRRRSVGFVAGRVPQPNPERRDPCRGSSAKPETYPAGGVSGKQTTKLTHYGRRTGRPHEVTIWFVLDGDKLYISTANVKRQWVQNVQKTPHIRLSIGGEKFEGRARFLADRAEHERAMAAIRRKYWMARPVIAFGRLLIAFGLMRDNTGSFEVTLAG